MTARTSPSRAHPRSRGENNRRGASTSTSLGSSPLTRGKLDELWLVAAHSGLIPAHAGKTEHDVDAIAGETGSSPLTRGKPLGGCTCQFVSGLIPAHAGKTNRLPGRFAVRRAHPRSRGENKTPPPRGEYSRGSSPLTRGKQVRQEREHGVVGLIPAHAGKTRLSVISPLILRAHPRSRGENTSACRWARRVGGSSPLTRGKLRAGLDPGRKQGLIPAHAGKTTCRTNSPTGIWAHPRSRGENRGRTQAVFGRWGSSPLTRGKR